MTQRKSKTPRPAATYRAARRNAVLRGETRGVWKGVTALYRPFIIKPPILKFLQTPGGDWKLISVKERKQPKLYPYSIERQATS